MVDLNELHKQVYQNKLNKKFNVTDISMEFALTYGELSEAYEAWRKKKENVGEEIADVVIYLLGLCEILNVNLEQELLDKIEINKNRVYKDINGVKTKTQWKLTNCLWKRWYKERICLLIKKLLN